MWSYLRRQLPKQTNLVDLHFFQIMVSFPKTSAESCYKRTSNMKVYYIIPLNSRLTGDTENFKIKIYYFYERLSLRYNLILKLLSLFHICF